MKYTALLSVIIHYGDIALTFTYPYLNAYAAYPGHLKLRVLPVLHRQEVVDIGVNTI